MRWLHGAWVRKTLLLSISLAAVTGIVSFLLPKSYRAEAKIIPQVPPATASSLFGLAASSGLGDLLGSQLGGTENPLLTYPEILTSRSLLERVATIPWPAARGPGGTIMAGLDIRGSDRLSLDKAVRKLRSITEVNARLRSGMIAITATTEDSVLSAHIVKCMLNELDRFNVEMRSSRQERTRQFIERRLADAHQDLIGKEQSLATFRQTNVRIYNSPQLQLEQARLEREVRTQSELYGLLIREYEMARIEEKRDTPTFSVVDPPTPPARKHRPRVGLNMLVAFVAGIGFRLASSYLPSVQPRRSDELGPR